MVVIMVIVRAKRLDGTKPEGSRSVFVEELGQQSSQNTVTAAHVKGTDRIKLDTGDLIRYKVDKHDPWIEASILSRGGKVTGAHKNWYNIKKSDGEETGVNLEKVDVWEMVPETCEEANVVFIPKSKHNDDECKAAKLVELHKLQEFNTYTEVPDESQFRISTTWALMKKGEEVRTQLVARGYEDKQSYPKDSPTVSKSTVRLILTIAASERWPIKTTDVKSAFLQGREMDRDVYLTPPKEANVKPGTLWKLIHCLYGLNDAGRHFYKSVAEELEKAGCQQSGLDPALFFKVQGKQLCGIVACHVDDCLHAGTQMFEDTVITKLHQRFLAGKMEGGHFNYVGFSIFQDASGIVMDHSGYIDRMEEVNLDPARASSKQDKLQPNEQKVFRQLVGRINWAVQGSRPHLAFDLVDLST